MSDEYKNLPTAPNELEDEQEGVILSDDVQQEIDEEVHKTAVKGLIQQFSGILSALLLLFGTLNIEYSWFNEESINAFVLFVTAIALFGISAYSTYKNSFSGAKAQKQKRDQLERERVEAVERQETGVE